MISTLVPYCDFSLEHPVCAAGGWARTIEEVRQLVDSTSCLVEVGSVILCENGRPGNTGETYWSDQSTVSYNSRGIPCPLESYFAQYLPEMIRLTREANKVFVWNVAGFSPEDFARGAVFGARHDVDVILLNVGCPNLWIDGTQKPIISHDKSSLEAVLIAVCDALITAGYSHIPIDVKFSSLEEEGARLINAAMIWQLLHDLPMIRALTLINTVPNKIGRRSDGGLAIQSPDVPTGSGGMGGARIKPIAQWYVRYFARQIQASYLPHLKHLTIRACGGVTDGQDVMDYLQVGEGCVSAVQVGTAVHDFGPKVLSDILSEYVDLCSEATTDS